MTLKYKTYNIRAVIVETDNKLVDMACGSCYHCCSNLSPFLTQEEFESGQYMYTLITTPDDRPAIAVPRRNGGCFYLEDGKCSIYDRRPRSCRQFDCRENHHPKITNKFLPEHEHHRGMK